MKIAIIISSVHRAADIDIPGNNIKKRLLAKGFKKIETTFENEPIYEMNTKLHHILLYTAHNNCTHHENIDKKIDAELFIFPTTHSAASGKPSLSVHTQGNWGLAELGGKPCDIAYCPAHWLKAAMIKIKELKEVHQLNDYEVVQEATHHGPQVDKPCMFIEIGSNLDQWDNPVCADIITETLLYLFSNLIPEKKTAIGIGGTHYLANFIDIQFNSDIAIGHVCPKYALEFLDKNMLKMAIDRTFPQAELAIIDWKGLGPYKEKIVNMLVDIGLEYKKTKDLKLNIF